MEAPKIAAAIPSITTIRDKLGYGDPHLTRCEAFYDDIRVFRKKFISKRGQAGTDFIDWKEKDHQLGLSEMTDTYLDINGNGPLFWPDDPSSPNHNAWRYSENSQLIKKLIKQLFFRLNLQQFRNQRYKQKANSKRSNSHSQSQADTHGQRDGSRDNPIDLYSAEPSNHSTTEDRASNTARSPAFHQDRFRVWSRGPSSELVDPALRAAPDDTDHNVQDQGDPYSGPASPGPSATAELHFAPINPRTIALTHQYARETSDDEPLAKRTKRQQRSATRPAGRISKAAKPSKRGSRAAQAAKPTCPPPRVSPRERRQRHDPNWATAEELASAIASPTSAPITPAPITPVLGAVPVTRPLSASHQNEASPGPEQTASSAFEDREAIEFIESNLMLSASPGPRGSPAPLAEMTSPPAPTVVGTARSSTIPERTASSRDVQNRAEQHAISRSRAGEHESVSRDTSVTAAANLAMEKRREAPLPPGKPKIVFSYRVIHSRAPTYKATAWTPKGKLSRMTLSELETEIPLNLPPSAIGWLFTLTGPNIDANHEVHRDQDDEFKDMKDYFDRLVRSSIPQNQDKGRLVFVFEIEALMDASQVTTINDEDFYEGDLDY